MDIFDTCIAGELEGQKGLTPVPNKVTAIKMISNGSYVANVRILNEDSVLVKNFIESFGNCGELNNKNREYGNKYISFIGWDSRNKSGEIANEKAQVWNIVLQYKDGKKETMVLSVATRY